MPLTEFPIAGVLSLKPTATGFEGRSTRGSDDTVWGGQLVAQALMAAGQDVPDDRLARALQSRFLRRARRSLPLEYEVVEGRDGGSHSFRRVVSRQEGKPVFDLAASFQVERQGYEHQDPPPAVASPQNLPPLAESGAWSEKWKEVYALDWPTIDWRAIDPEANERDLGSRSQSWLRVTEPLPDDRRTQVCAFAYVTDLPVMCPAIEPHGLAFDTPDLRLASLDHMLWLHHPVSPNDWLLFDQLSPAAAGGRTLAWSKVFSAGRLVASIAQEGVLG